jgi:cytochrome oxidase Cu insertion factor (SCO1/SenC/PrrC family)
MSHAHGHSRSGPEGIAGRHCRPGQAGLRDDGSCARCSRRWLDLFDRRFIGLTGTESAIESVQRAAGVPLAQRAPSDNTNYVVAHANFVLAYTKDNLAHVICPGGVSKQDWVHDLPLLVNASWSTR